MKKQQLVIVVCAIGIAVFIFKGFFLSSDEKIIEQTLALIENEMEFDASLKPLAVAERVKQLNGLISQDIQISLLVDSAKQTYTGFDYIKTGALLGSRLLQSSSIHRLNTEIRVTGTSASAQFYAIGMGIDAKGESLRERFQVHAHFVKTDGDWILNEVTISNASGD